MNQDNGKEVFEHYKRQIQAFTRAELEALAINNHLHYERDDSADDFRAASYLDGLPADHLDKQCPQIRSYSESAESR